MPLNADLVAQSIKPAIEIPPFAPTEAIATIPSLEARQSRKPAAKLISLGPSKRAVANAPIDPSLEVDLPLVD
jgi:hypothetical protein